VPGLPIAAIGIAVNTLAITLNGGRMPIHAGAFELAGFTPADIAGDPFHFLLVTDSVADFVAAGGLLGDVVPIPLPLINSVVSIGDILLAIGIFWTIVYSMTRPAAPSRSSVAVASTAERAPGALGSYDAGVAFADAGAVAGEHLPEDEGRAQSPYLRLVRNRNFSMLWTGQLISFFGDRLHQVALGFLVLDRFGELEVGFAFAAAALPNMLLGPIAGAFVDRWDRRTTMIVCDLVRAGLVLLIPVAIEISILLVYAIAFGVATVTLIFRPAKTAVVPQIVEQRDLVTANSANTVGETFADLGGLAIAGLIVAALSNIIGAVFVIDAATYLLSAAFIFAMSMPRLGELERHRGISTLLGDIVEGWRFLRRQAELFANTLVSVVAQIATGTAIVVSFAYAENILTHQVLAGPTRYGLIMASIGVGSVIGGIGVGWVGGRIRKGPMILAGYVMMGVSMMAIGLVTDTFAAMALFFASGFANMLFLVPSITLFQERTPQRLMGRVVATRQALVFAAISASMAVSGWLSAIIGPPMVFALSGGICAGAALIGLLVPALRNAR
jgi:MFS transporter, DHA3 family, macrolide efflux protein